MVLCVSLLRLIRSMYNTYNIFGMAFLFQQWSRQNIDVNVFANERRFVMVVVGLTQYTSANVCGIEAYDVFHRLRRQVSNSLNNKHFINAAFTQYSLSFRLPHSVDYHACNLSLNFMRMFTS